MNSKFIFAVVVAALVAGVLGGVFGGSFSGRGVPAGATSTVTGSNALSNQDLYKVLESLAEDQANTRNYIVSTSSPNFAMPTVWKCYGVGVPATACPLNVSSTEVYATSSFTGFNGLSNGDYVLLSVASGTAVQSSTLSWNAFTSSTNTVYVNWKVNAFATSSVPANTDVYITVFKRNSAGAFNFPTLQISTGTLAQ